MLSTALLILSGFIAPTFADPYTFWIDKSCKDRPTFSTKWITDRVRLAKNANQRNTKKDEDETFALSFETTMDATQDDADSYTLRETNKKDTTYNLVSYVSSTIASLVETDDQDTSNIRFVCDDDPVSASVSQDRLQLVPDRKDDSEPNSKRTFDVDQEIFDQYNWIVYPVKQPGCKGQRAAGAGVLQAQTFIAQVEEFDPKVLSLVQYNGRKPPSNLPKFRSVISLCEPLFKRPAGLKDTWDDIPDSEALHEVPGGLTNRWFWTVISNIIGHELKHAHPQRLVDVDDPPSYAWQDIKGMDVKNGDTVNNVNNHMFLDILSELQRRHIRLPDELEKADAGQLIFDENVS